MRKVIETTSADVEVQDEDIILLGVASVETKGGGGEPVEPLGENMEFGISNE